MPGARVTGLHWCLPSSLRSTGSTHSSFSKGRRENQQSCWGSLLPVCSLSCLWIPAASQHCVCCVPALPRAEGEAPSQLSPGAGKEHVCAWGDAMILFHLLPSISESTGKHPPCETRESLIRSPLPALEVPLERCAWRWRSARADGPEGLPLRVKPWAQNSSEMSPSNLSLLPKSLLEWSKVTLGCYFQPHTS